MTKNWKELLIEIQHLDLSNDLRTKDNDKEENTSLGIVYTPEEISNLLFQLSEYTNLISKNEIIHLLEPSCGSGSILSFIIPLIGLSSKFPGFKLKDLIIDAVDLDYKALVTTNIILLILLPKYIN